MSRQLNIGARDQIVEAAHSLFYKSGFKGVSMDDIAHEAGIKKANLFHYYPTKEALGLAVFDRATKAFQERWSKLFQEDKEPIPFVARFFDNASATMKECGCCGGCFVGNMAQELSDSNETLRQKVADHLQSWHRQLATYFARHQAAKYFVAEFDPVAAAHAVLTLFEGAMIFAKATRQTAAIVHSRQMAITYLEGFRSNAVDRHRLTTNSNKEG